MSRRHPAGQRNAGSHRLGGRTGRTARSRLRPFAGTDPGRPDRGEADPWPRRRLGLHVHPSSGCPLQPIDPGRPRLRHTLSGRRGLRVDAGGPRPHLDMRDTRPGSPNTAPRPSCLCICTRGILGPPRSRGPARPVPDPAPAPAPAATSLCRPVARTVPGMGTAPLFSAPCPGSAIPTITPAHGCDLHRTMHA